MLKAYDYIANLADEFVGATGKFRDVGVCAFGNVSEERSLDEFLVQEDEERSNDAPEQENDAEPLRIGWVPNVWRVGNHVGEVGGHQNEEQHREGNVNQNVPPAANFQIVVAGVDEIITERRDTESEVARKAGRRRSFFNRRAPLDVCLLYTSPSPRD